MEARPRCHFFAVSVAADTSNCAIDSTPHYDVETGGVATRLRAAPEKSAIPHEARLRRRQETPNDPPSPQQQSSTPQRSQPPHAPQKPAAVRPPPTTDSSPASSASSTAPEPEPPAAQALSAELEALRPLANAYDREFIGPHNRAKRARLDAAIELAASNAAAVAIDNSNNAAGAGGDSDVTPAELQRYRTLREAYNAFHRGYMRALRAAWRQLKQAHDEFVREFLGPDNAAKRVRLEAPDGGGDGALAAERAAYEAKRRAYEDFEALYAANDADASPSSASASATRAAGTGHGDRSSSGSGSTGGRRSALPKAQRNPDGSRALLAPPDMTAAEWDALRAKSQAYVRDYLKNQPLKRLLEDGGGSPAEQQAFRVARAAYNEYHARSRRAPAPHNTPRLPHRRVAYPTAVAPEVARLEQLRADFRRHRRLLDPARRAAFLAKAEKDAAAGGESSGGSAAALAELERLQAVANEYQRVYAAGSRKARKAEAQAKRQASSLPDGGGVEGEDGAAVAWRDYLTDEQLRRLDELEADHRLFRRLKLNLVARRQAFLADDADGAKRAQYDALRRANNEWMALYRRARRAAERDGAVTAEPGEEHDPASREEGPDTVVEWTTTGRRRYFRKNALTLDRRRQGADEPHQGRGEGAQSEEDTATQPNGERAGTSDVGGTAGGTKPGSGGGAQYIAAGDSRNARRQAPVDAWRFLLAKRFAEIGRRAMAAGNSLFSDAGASAVLLSLGRRPLWAPALAFPQEMRIRH